MSKIKVLYVTNIPAPYKVSFFNELGLYCDLTVIFEREKASDREEKWHDYEFKNFRAIFLNGINYGREFSISFDIKRQLDRIEFDIIVLSNYSSLTGMIAIEHLKRRNIPFTISVDGGLIDYGESNLKRRLKTRLISSADAWLSTGEFTNKYLTYYGASQNDIYIYPFTTMKKENIIKQPLSKLEKEEKRRKLNIPYKNMVLSVGSFIPRKGFDVLIRAAKDFTEDTGVYIIGGTPTAEYLDLINQYKIDNIHFMDYLEYEELKEYYLTTNLFVLPTREDIWGLVINEAMTNALPVITTTNCVAGIEMVKEGANGYLVPKDSKEQLVARTNEVLSNEELQESMANCSIEIAHTYTIENMAKTVLNALSEIKIKSSN